MTKNSVLLALVLFISFQQSNGQIELGLKGGYTNSWPNYGEIELPDDAQTDVSGYNLSLFIGSSINNNFGFSINPGYIKRGAACLPGWQPLFDGDTEVYLNYFELPLLINMKFLMKSVGIEIVPSVGYGISYLNSASAHREMADGTDLEIKIPVGTGSFDAYDRYDHGFHFNIKLVRSILENYLIFVESAYYHGMKDFDPRNTSKNRSLNFNLGLGLSI